MKADIFTSIIILILAPCISANGTTFSQGQSIGKGSYPKLADLDGDGDLDIVAVKDVSVMGQPIYTPIWQENTGTSFTERSIIDWTSIYMRIEPADLNGDGKMDLIMIGNDLAWLENDGARPPHFLAHEIEHLPLQSDLVPRNTCAVDMDGDGDLDVLASYWKDPIGSNGNLLIWYENNGAHPPQFIKHVATEMINPPFYDALASADMDGDGRMDILAGTWEGTYFYRNLGGSPPAFAESKLFDGRGGIRVADLNGDGRRDVIVGFSWLENQGTTFTLRLYAPTFTPVDRFYGYVAVGELDHDPETDLLAYDPSGLTGIGQNLCWFESDGQTSPTFTVSQIGPYHDRPLIGDLNGNGNRDILCNYYNDFLKCYVNQDPLQPVTVLAPNDANLVFSAGGAIEVYWRTASVAGTAVRVELWRGTQTNIACLGDSWADPEGRGNRQFILPQVLTAGGYRIRVVSVWDNQYTDFSDEPFIIRGTGNGVESSSWILYQ